MRLRDNYLCYIFCLFLLIVLFQSHAFVVTSSHTGVAKTFYARANSDNYFLLPSALFNPRLAAETATVRVVCTMQRPTAEEVRIDVYPEWSPRGATRFLELVTLHP